MKEPSGPDLAYVDELTSLFNRRYLKMYMKAKFFELQGSETRLSMVMIDVDNFKTFNDTFGHQFGDKVLVQVAQVMRNCIRKDDIAIRYAGDEFMLILPQVPMDGARRICERIAEILRTKLLRTGGARGGAKITLSMGISQFPEDGTDLDSLLGQADRALYYAKHKGKDRVSLSIDIPADLITDSDRFKIFPSPKMVGRGPDLEQIADGLGAALAGRAGVTLFEGSPGIGKSRLLEEITARAQKDHFMTLADTCTEEQTCRPFGALIRLLDRFLMESSDETDRFVFNLTENELAAVAAHIPELALIQDLPGGDYIDGLSEKDRRCHLYNGLKGLLKNIAAEGPTLVAMDDIHWMDEATYTLLATLVGGQEPINLFVAGTFNKAESLAAPQPLHRLLADETKGFSPEVRPLPPLTETETAKLIGKIFQGLEKDTAFVRFVQERSGGNPFYIEEFLKFMLKKGLINRLEVRWTVGTFSPGDVPADLTDLVGARIESLNEEAREVSKDASAIGEAVDIDVLQNLANMSEGVLLEFLDKARKENLLTIQETDKGGLDIQFNTPSLRDVIYQSIPKEQQKDLHKQIGEFEEKRAEEDLPSMVWKLAYHFKRAEALQKAEEYAQVAAQQASAIFCAEEAMAYQDEEGDEELVGEPLDEGAIKKVNEFIRAMRVTVQRVQIYTAEHKVALNAIEDLYRRIGEILLEAKILTMSDVEGRLVVNREEMPRHLIDAVSEQNLITLLREQALRSVTLIKGVTKKEFTLLLKCLAVKGDESIEEIIEKHRARHIRLNRTKYVEETAGDGTGSGADANGKGGGKGSAGSSSEADKKDDGASSRRPTAVPPMAMRAEAIPHLLGPIQDVGGLLGSLGEISSTLQLDMGAGDAEAIRMMIAQHLLDRGPEQLAEVLSQHEDGSMEALNLLSSIESLLKGEEGEGLLRKISVALTALRAFSDVDGKLGKGMSILQKLLGEFQAEQPERRPVEIPDLDKVRADQRKVVEVAEDERANWTQEQRIDDSVSRLASGRPLRWGPELVEDLPHLIQALAKEGRSDPIHAVIRIVVHHMKSPSREIRVEAIGAVGSLVREMSFPGCEALRSQILGEMLELLQSEEFPENLEMISEIFVHQTPVLVQRGQYEILTKIVHVLSEKYRANESAQFEKKAVAEAVLDRLARDDLFEVFLADIQSGDPQRQEHGRHLFTALGTDATDPLLEIIKTHGDARVRKASASILKEIGESALRRIFESLTMESSPVTLKNLIHGCEVFGDMPNTVKHMMHLLKNPNKTVRLETLRVFGRMKTKETEQILLDLILSMDPAMRQAAIHFIGVYRYDAASDSLVGLLSEKKGFSAEGGAELQREICIAVGRLRVEGATHYLEEIVKPKKSLFFGKEAPEVVQAAAIWALGEIGGPKAMKILKDLGHETAPALKTATELALSREEE